MARCVVCGKVDRLVSEPLAVCGACLRAESAAALARAEAVHRSLRGDFGLPAQPPLEGKPCGGCANRCRIPEGANGYCGVRRNVAGALLGGTEADGWVSWYHDPLPTNCVADWVCDGSIDTGRSNLAVFYESCSFDCLFCQNWHFRKRPRRRQPVGSDVLATAANARTGCICFFGGDPSTQMEHALAASRRILARAGKRPPRICWETNGAMARGHLREAARLSLESGGCIKFDLKAWSAGIHLGLCGVANGVTLDNFAWLAEFGSQRREPPFLVASTLLVPGYVGPEEVEALAAFIARLDPGIPYSLLGFHPDFCMSDLPATSRAHAKACLKAAHAAGLRRLHIGNPHVLGADYS